MSSKADSFSTFLQTVNSDRPGSRAAGGGFDIEASAKQALRLIASRKALSGQELGRTLELTPDQTSQILDYLERTGLIARSGEMVELTGFGKDALGTFSVS